MIKYNIERFKIKISLFKHKFIYRVYKNVTLDHSIGSYKLFEGTYNECRNYCKLNNINLK